MLVEVPEESLFWAVLFEDLVEQEDGWVSPADRVDAMELHADQQRGGVGDHDVDTPSVRLDLLPGKLQILLRWQFTGPPVVAIDALVLIGTHGAAKEEYVSAVRQGKDGPAGHVVAPGDRDLQRLPWGGLHALLQVVMVLVVPVAPVELRAAQLDGVLVEPSIP